MLQFLKGLFPCKEERDRLRTENKILKTQLSKKQDQIDTVNRYWKRKFHRLTSNSGS